MAIIINVHGNLRLSCETLRRFCGSNQTTGTTAGTFRLVAEETQTILRATCTLELCYFTCKFTLRCTLRCSDLSPRHINLRVPGLGLGTRIP